MFFCFFFAQPGQTVSSGVQYCWIWHCHDTKQTHCHIFLYILQMYHIPCGVRNIVINGCLNILSTVSIWLRWCRSILILRSVSISSVCGSMRSHLGSKMKAISCLVRSLDDAGIYEPAVRRQIRGFDAVWDLGCVAFKRKISPTNIGCSVKLIKRFYTQGNVDYCYYCHLFCFQASICAF